MDEEHNGNEGGEEELRCGGCGVGVQCLYKGGLSKSAKVNQILEEENFDSNYLVLKVRDRAIGW